MENRYFHLLTNMPLTSSFYRHCHNDYEFFFFIRGDAVYNIEGELFDMQSRTMLVIRPADYHYIQVLSDKPYERMAINFTVEDAALNAKLQSLGTKYDITSNINSMLTMLSINQKIYSSEDFDVLLAAVIPQVILELTYGQSLQSGSATAATNPAVAKILQYINQNLNRPLNLDILSKELFLSKSSISHSFKEYMKTSVIKYIRTKKMLQAQSLIAAGIKPTMASEMCGYIDYATFYRNYCSVIGAPPSLSQKKGG